MCGSETPYPIWIKSDLDKILHGGRYLRHNHLEANFGDDRLRDLEVAGGVQILPFPIGFRCGPYNTLGLSYVSLWYIVTYSVIHQ